MNDNTDDTRLKRAIGTASGLEKQKRNNKTNKTKQNKTKQNKTNEIETKQGKNKVNKTLTPRLTRA